MVGEAARRVGASHDFQGLDITTALELRDLATRLGGGQLEIPVAASYRLADAARALARVTGGGAGGAIVLVR